MIASHIHCVVIAMNWVMRRHTVDAVCMYERPSECQSTHSHRHRHALRSDPDQVSVLFNKRG